MAHTATFVVQFQGAVDAHAIGDLPSMRATVRLGDGTSARVLASDLMATLDAAAFVITESTEIDAAEVQFHLCDAAGDPLSWRTLCSVAGAA